MRVKGLVVALTGALLAGTAPAAPDWGKVPARTIKVFYPGQASLEWVLNKADHSAATDVLERKRPCTRCHDGDASAIGNLVVAGKPAGSSDTVLEPRPIAGKAGWLPVQFQAAHDGEKIYLRFEWPAPQPSGTKMDEANEVKLTVLFDGGGTVAGAEQNGCWSTCHDDLRTMRGARDDRKTKYVKDADLAAGRFYDLIQFRSGEGARPLDGYVADERVMEGGRALVKAEGAKVGDKWIVTFERLLAGGGMGDHTIAAGKVYGFGFAIHEDHTGARYHYVSLGYQFGLDKANPEARNHINVTRP